MVNNKLFFFLSSSQNGPFMDPPLSKTTQACVHYNLHECGPECRFPYLATSSACVDCMDDRCPTYREYAPGNPGAVPDETPYIVGGLVVVALVARQ